MAIVAATRSSQWLISSALLGVGLLLSALVLSGGLARTLDVDRTAVLVLGTLQILSHTIPSRLLTFGGSAESITLDEVLFAPLLIALTPKEFLAFALAATVAGSLVTRRSPLKVVFNAGQYLTACACGYLTHQILAGPSTAEVTPRLLLAAAAGSLVICAVSRLTVTSMIAYSSGSRWLETVRVPKSHLGAWLGAIALGVSGATMSFTHYPWGFIPSLVLVASVHRAFSAQIKEEGARRQAELLQRHTAALRQTGSRQAIEGSLRASAAELVGGKSAAILDADQQPGEGSLSAPMANGQQLVVNDRIGPGSWSVQEQETLTALAGVAADTLRSADLISHLRNITDGQSEAVLAIDVAGVITFANPAAVRVLGRRSVDQTVGRQVAEVFRLEHERVDLDLVAMTAEAASAEDADAVLRVPDARNAGTERLDVSYSFSALTEGGTVSGAVLVMRDVSERRAFQVAMTYRAMHDELTGLPNRRSFLERLDLAMRSGDHNAMVFVDLDRFKLVNDSFGHLVGDQVLVQLSDRLLQHGDADGITARLSGDEFVMLLAGRTDDVSLTAMVEALMSDLREPYLIDGHAIFITVSLGVASTSPGETRDDVLLAADAAAYAAKSGGRDCVRFATPELVAATKERLETEARLRQAIDDGGLHLNYQPIFDTKTRTMVSVEALVRWQRNGVTVPPDQFIPLAEESGLIVYLGRWVLQEACTTTHRWNTEHPERAPVTVSVNLSALQLAQPRLAEEVGAVLDRTGLPASQLTLEITETAVLSDIEANLPTLVQLRALGVHLSVDDFGTGYSSLAYLRRLPVDVVKLDASFIAGLGQDPVDAQIVAAVLRLCKALGHQVVAEGVETELQRQTLAHMGSTFMQGYLLAKPMTGAKFEEYWAEMYQGHPREILPAP